MSRTIAPVCVAVVALAASLLTTPAHAATEFAITVDPSAARPGDTVTVSGDAVDPICAEDGVAIRFHYTKPDGSSATAVVSTTTDAAGHFSADITVPADAVAAEEASVTAFIADCTPPGEPSTGPRSSESDPFNVVPHEGDFEISRTSGEPGDVLEFAGTNCWGGEVAFFFGDDVLSGEPDDSKEFGGQYVLPDAPDGVYEVTAECPGTDYRVFAFRLVNPEAPPAPPARPVTRRPTFAG